MSTSVTSGTRPDRWHPILLLPGPFGAIVQSDHGTGYRGAVGRARDREDVILSYAESWLWLNGNREVPDRRLLVLAKPAREGACRWWSTRGDRDVIVSPGATAGREVQFVRMSVARLVDRRAGSSGPTNWSRRCADLLPGTRRRR